MYVCMYVWTFYVRHEPWQRMYNHDHDKVVYSFDLGVSMASATLRRWIFPVAVLGICGTIQT